ncbi:MAG: hydroxymethylpyrimidine/phosphomethylpyrimidine kinase [Burkholderiales bacterium]|nr:hydroxymethylpyrimidine/phosphomethylpyrimidine kinase [Burkholderiales bacterium]
MLEQQTGDTRPAVLVFAGLDPSGGAGLAADITAINAQGAHAMPVLTVLTVQDNDRVHSVRALASSEVEAQARALIAKIKISAVKLGIIGSIANAQLIATLARELRQTQPDLPLILDPVLASGHGDNLAQDDPLAIMQILLPLATVVLPNLPEIARLCPQFEENDARAAHLLAQGCQYVLLKGGHASGAQVENVCYSSAGTQHWQWPRLAGEFHGSGCTLASALAGQLARGQSMESALLRAQEYCQAALQHAYPIASGQWMPQR